MAENRVDFRDMVNRLASQFGTRIEMRQVGARDEARLVADYERCGQHCCCKNFLKVLKPVSMRQAKVQKATLDPLKISGRCGRLMCCLRYEDQTYKELKTRLPHKNTRVGTSEGPGVVVDSKILVQLVLVRLEHDQREVAVPVEELLDPDKCPQPARVPDAAELREARERRREERSGRRDQPPRASEPPPAPVSKSPLVPGIDDPLRGLSESEAAARAGQEGGSRKRRRRRRRKGGGGAPMADGAGEQRTPSESERHHQQDAFRAMSQAHEQDAGDDDAAGPDDEGGAPDHGADSAPQQQSQGPQEGGRKRRRRRRRRRRGGQGGEGGPSGPSSIPPAP
jgi:hypothetical protein